VIAKWHRFFSNKIAQNCHCLFSNKWSPKGVAYSAIKDCKITITYSAKKKLQNCYHSFSDKRAPNCHPLFSDKNSAKLAAIT
jgi:hypothetical protein